MEAHNWSDVMFHVSWPRAKACSPWVATGKETTSRGPWGEPVTTAQPIIVSWVRLPNFGRIQNLLTRGTKWVSRSSRLCCSAIVRRLSTAWYTIGNALSSKDYLPTLSLTMVSSTVARDSRGGRRQCTCSFPPTRGVKVPSCSARASNTSSSS